MSQIRWDNVDDQTKDTSQNYVQFGDAIQRSLGVFGSGLDKYQATKEDNASKLLQARMLSQTDPVAYEKALQSGSIFAGINPALVNSQAYNALQNYSTTLQDKLIKEDALKTSIQNRQLMGERLKDAPILREGLQLSNTGKQYDNTFRQNTTPTAEDFLRKYRADIDQSMAAMESSKYSLQQTKLSDVEKQQVAELTVNLSNVTNRSQGIEWLNRVGATGEFSPSVMAQVTTAFDGKFPLSPDVLPNDPMNPFDAAVTPVIAANSPNYLPNSLAPKPIPGSLAEIIASGEGGNKNPYGAYNTGDAGNSNGKSIDFGNMTFRELMRRQALPKSNPERLLAVGKYQVIPTTMFGDNVDGKGGAFKALGLNLDDKVTPENQERIFAEYLVTEKQPSIGKSIRGDGSRESLLKGIEGFANEFASVANPHTGATNYAGKGKNKASIFNDKMLPAMTKANATYHKMIATGKSDKEAYKAAMTGINGNAGLAKETQIALDQSEQEGDAADKVAAVKTMNEFIASADNRAAQYAEAEVQTAAGSKFSADIREEFKGAEPPIQQVGIFLGKYLGLDEDNQNDLVPYIRETMTKGNITDPRVAAEYIAKTASESIIPGWFGNQGDVSFHPSEAASRYKQDIAKGNVDKATFAGKQKTAFGNATTAIANVQEATKILNATKQAYTKGQASAQSVTTAENNLIKATQLAEVKVNKADEFLKQFSK